MTVESKDPPAVISVLFVLMGVGIIGAAGYTFLNSPSGEVLLPLGLAGIGGLFTLLAVKSLRSSDTYVTVSQEDI